MSCPPLLSPSRPIFARDKKFTHLSSLSRKSLKGPKAMIAFEREEELKRISKQIEDLMSDDHMHISPNDVEVLPAIPPDPLSFTCVDA